MLLAAASGWSQVSTGTLSPPFREPTADDVAAQARAIDEADADIVWVYMGPNGGPAATLPELPHMEFGLVPPSHRFVSKKWQDCNWVQALEGSIDTAHFTYTHLVFD